jgi:hypothetical protein
MQKLSIVLFISWGARPIAKPLLVYKSNPAG